MGEIGLCSEIGLWAWTKNRHKKIKSIARFRYTIESSSTCNGLFARVGTGAKDAPGIGMGNEKACDIRMTEVESEELVERPGLQYSILRADAIRRLISHMIFGRSQSTFTSRYPPTRHFHVSRTHFAYRVFDASSVGRPQFLLLPVCLPGKSPPGSPLTL